jgi:hypothetical protein
MTQQHPITPPPELVGQWYDCATAAGPNYLQEIADRSAQWGADQELEACCEWVDWKWSGIKSRELRASRRPKPPSLKEQALVALHAVATGANDMREQRQDFETIRLALEQLDG